MDKLLNQFLAVADAGTISGAATALFVTQPTLTFNMRKLEETMGVPLLLRSSRGVELTEYGETLYQNARLMRRLYDNTLSAIAHQRGRTEQGLRIGSGYSWWTLFIRDMAIDYSARYPNARIHVSLGNQLRCMDQLLSGDISLFVAHEIEGLNRSTGAKFIPLSRVGQGYFCRVGHPLLGRPRGMAEIEAYPADERFATRNPAPALLRDLEPHHDRQRSVRPGQIHLCLQFADGLPRLCRAQRCRAGAYRRDG
jgi:LysR family transcriptional regulator of abg operon